MSNKPKVSVCLPVYNGARYLDEAIQSVLNQTHENWELLIADDVSSDESPAIIEKYAKQDSRIIAWRNERNKGVCANYNDCVTRVSGSLIKFVAQDDILEPKAIERLSEVLLENPTVSLVSCAKRNVDDNGKELEIIRRFPQNTFATGKEIILFNLIQLTNFIGEPITVMIRATDPPILLDPTFRYYSDVEFYYRVLAHGDYYYLDEVLCTYRRDAGEVTTRGLKGIHFAPEIFELWDRYHPYLEEIGETEEQFRRRAIEKIALRLDDLKRNRGLRVEDVMENRVSNGRSPNDASMADWEESRFKELAFSAAGYLTELLAELDHLKRCNANDPLNFQRELNKIHSSISWRATAPIRAVRPLIKKLF